MGGLNGVVSGWGGVYDWRSVRGWLGFALDSTWGLALTAAGLGIHLLNLFRGDRDYRPGLSRRAGFHVYGGGVAVRKGFTWTLGNVMTNVGSPSLDDPATAERRRRFVLRHEGLHVWQNRIFGPLYPVGYLLWMLAGAVAGTLLWLVRRREWFKTVEALAYYDNPFEFWAYRRDERWPPPAADPELVWGAGRSRIK